MVQKILIEKVGNGWIVTFGKGKPYFHKTVGEVLSYVGQEMSMEDAQGTGTFDIDTIATGKPQHIREKEAKIKRERAYNVRGKSI
jgi:hypothetical protein